MSKDEKITIKKSFVDGLKYPDKGQVLHFDSSLQGFGIRVTKGAKSYFVQTRVKGKVKRVTIGKHGHFTPETARIQAKKLLGLMAQGIDPLEQKQEQQVRGKTLAEVFEDYKASRTLRPRTLQEYTNNLKRCVPDWLDKPITVLTRDKIEKRLMKVATANGPRGEGKGQAGQTYRLLRSLMRFSIENYETASGPILTADPTRNLSRGRPWTENTRRQSSIQKRQLASWYQRVKGLDNSTMQDYLLFCLLTGLRRSEAASLKWSNVDLNGDFIKIDAGMTKNKQEHRLPLSDYLHRLLTRRLNENQLSSPYVFPGKGITGHLVETKATQKNIAKDGGVKFMMHDLRRTFMTTAESLDIPYYALKRLINHKTSGDVTAGYIVTDVERLRQPMQQITDHFVAQMGISNETTTKSKPRRTSRKLLKIANAVK